MEKTRLILLMLLGGALCAGRAPAGTAALAATGAVVTDTFDPVLSNLAVSYNGTAWSDPANYSYNATTGTFATQEGQITVPAATFTQDAATGEWTVTPGAGTLTVTGTI